MRNAGMAGLFVAVVGIFFGCCYTGTVWATESAPLVAASESPLHTVLNNYTVREIYDAAYDVIFGSLGLSKKKSEDCNCSSNKADLLTGRIEALSADGITFVFRIHCLDEHSCGVWIHAQQDSDVPGDLKKYSQLIYDRTIRKLQEKDQLNESVGGADGGMAFSAEYKMSIEQMYKVINDTANQVGIGHNTSTRNRFTVIGNFISGQTQFDYKGYMVADDKLKFRFSLNGRGADEAQRYMFETIYNEFQRQLKLQQSK